MIFTQAQERLSRAIGVSTAMFTLLLINKGIATKDEIEYAMKEAENIVDQEYARALTSILEGRRREEERKKE